MIMKWQRLQVIIGQLSQNNQKVITTWLIIVRSQQNIMYPIWLLYGPSSHCLAKFYSDYKGGNVQQWYISEIIMFIVLVNNYNQYNADEK